MLSSFTVQDFRCIEAATLEFGDTNLVIGPNASGKTSLLEAIFFLGRARSFRTARLGPLIRDGATELVVAGQVQHRGRRVPVGLRRGRRGAEMRVDGRPLGSLAELTETFPVQVLDPTVHGLLDGGPRERRRFLDWGVFHVERSFHGAWQRYSRALRQRNVILRNECGRADALPWEHELAEAGEMMDRQRRQYLAAITAELERIAGVLLGGDEPVSIEYSPGWPAGVELAEALAQSWARDLKAGNTQVGPHRADLMVRVGTHKVQDRVSRGQQKVLAGALVLTQLAEYRRRTGHPAALLADDLAAELDPAFLGRFVDLAQEGASQLFITAIRPENLPESLLRTARMFHVEHGVFRAAEEQ